MTVSPGARLGPYEIESAIGAGGMGEVYKARDTRLDRTVAIKVLPPALGADSDRRARFEREAKTIAGLSHSHICTLYDVGESEGSTFLVMEYLTGETLAERLERGPLPLERALTVAAEIADALASAHRQGVIHRDLKPGNVMLTKAGAKLLDFGLAKLKGHGEQPAAARLGSVATRSAPLTGEGMIVGTLQYMAPEQLEGKPADARTDLWALGALLYEMVTGRRAFEGTSAASLIGAILEREPAPVSTLQPLTPPGVDRLVRLCLAKDPEGRWQNAQDVADELCWLRETSGGAAPAVVRPARRRGLRAALTVAGGCALVLVGAAAAWLLRTPPAPASPRSVVRFAIDVPPSRTVTAIALSPDGRSLAYVGTQADQRQIYLRHMDQSADAPVAGTEGAAASAVRFSPDNLWIAFAIGTRLKRVPVAGGEAITLLEAPSSSAERAGPIGVIEWAPNGTILFTVGSTGIWRLPPSTATPSRLTRTDAGRGEYGHWLPTLLPDGRHVIFTIRTGMDFDAAPLAAVAVNSGQQVRLLPDGLGALCVPDGHLVYASGGKVLAAPFDAVQARLLGVAVPVVESVDYRGVVPLFSLSASGDLAYVPAPAARPTLLVRLDRRGQEQTVAALPSDSRGALSVSPDGRRVAVYRAVSRRMSAWILDLTRGIPEELPLDASAHSLIWRPDGQTLTFSSDRDGAANIFSRNPASREASEKLVASLQHGDPGSWSRDGRWLAYAEVSPTTSWDLWTYDAATRKTAPFVRTDALERNPAISPSGRWLAYCSDRSARDEVYVDSFPTGGKRIQISGEGGSEPVWGSDGRELFYVSGTSLNRVGTTDGPELNPGRPEPLFEVTRYLRASTFGPAAYAVAPGSRAFYFIKPVPVPAEPTRIHIVLGWLDEFTRSLKR